MRINLDKEYAIVRDPYQYTLYYRAIIKNKDSANFGEENLTSRGHFATLGKALAKYTTIKVEEGVDVISLDEYIARLEAVYKDVEALTMGF